MADGDTLTLKDLGTVRFIGVDTPEKNHPFLPVQYMAQESSAFTRKLCLGKQIRLDYDPFDSDKRGNYGRILGYVYLADGTFVQQALLQNGYAAAYTKYPFDEKRKKAFLLWERRAKQQKAGLWRDDGMSEVLWVLKKGQLLIRVESAAGNFYRLRLGNWISEKYEAQKLVPQLLELYKAAHELAPEDLRAQLKRLGYKKSKHSWAKKTVLLMGMAHKKWGLLYGGFVKPRLPSHELIREVERLFSAISQADESGLEKTLPKTGYRNLPADVMAGLNLQENAKAVLANPHKTISENAISWEKAGKYVGKHVVVEGRIVRTHNSGKACFLNFHRNFTRYMTLVIFGNRFHRFPDQPEVYYLNMTVRVRGKIKEFEGKPEMVLENPAQIEVIGP